MGRRSDHNRDELKDLILEATKKLIVAEGPVGLSARKIAKDIGYTVGTLYLVFKNQDDLVMQVNEQTLDDMKAHIEQASAAAKDPQEKIKIMGREYYNFALKNQHLWRLVYEYQLKSEDDLSKGMKERINHLFALVEQTYNSLPTAIDTPDQLRQTAATLWASVHGITMLSISNKLLFVYAGEGEDLIEHLIEEFLN